VGDDIEIEEENNERDYHPTIWEAEKMNNSRKDEKGIKY
jgi:hypothetical protein